MMIVFIGDITVYFLATQVFAFTAFRYSGGFPLVCSPCFSLFSGRLGTAASFLLFVLLDFSVLCSTIIKKLLAVPKNLADAEIYGEHSQEIYWLYLKARQMLKSMENIHKKSAGCA